MKPVCIVVLTKYEDIFTPFVESVNKFLPSYPVVVVRDGEEVPAVEGWQLVQGPEKFSMAGNGNLGLKAAPQDHDILYCGDDVRFIKASTIEKLQEEAYSDPSIGILSPRLIGRGSPSQVNPKTGVHEVRPLEFWFPCIYIKRELIDKIGYLDEEFNEFGSDDLDYCIRTKLAGYKLSVTSKIAVQHQASAEGGPTTFCKKIGQDEWLKQQNNSYEKLRKKYGVSQATFSRAIGTGDCELLRNPEPEGFVPAPSVTPSGQMIGPSREEAREYLKTRSLFLATPAYGGQFSINYVNSLLQLVDILHDLGIPRMTTFMYNESLVTRARNKMANQFMNATYMKDEQTFNFTDFVFIDADIGFDARAVVSLLLRPEAVIGAPCVRKNLRLDRIMNVGKRDYEKELSRLLEENPAELTPPILKQFMEMAKMTNGHSYEDLQKLCGEFVINFPPDSAPPTFNLGEMVEVQEIGTGLMRVKREVFEKYAEAYPERWYLPMVDGVDERLPIYMYFQAEIDPDTKQWNPNGIPDYISEDYSFCRNCRKLGIKVWMAPWVKTSHAGTYIFQGDMEAVAVSGGTLRK